jgi:hypothetical protein
MKPATGINTTTLWAGRLVYSGTFYPDTNLGSNLTTEDEEGNLTVSLPYNNFNLFGNGEIIMSCDSSRGLLKMGSPGYSGWHDISLVPWGYKSYRTSWEGVNDKFDGSIYPAGYHVGNLGTPSYGWDTLWCRSIGISSSRNLKTNIAIYNIENAYEELKNMPIYTYYYKGLSDTK